MHIPDGYLSPETCAGLYVASAPFWAVAVRRVRHVLHTRFLPLISLFSAFSFVVMMFNLPLPGGTSGHAVGVAIAAIVLGPWASILVVSLALVIQSIFFGDGGVTAIGANCFNMAIVGSFSAYIVYRLLARGAALGSRRRVLAAAVAGYLAINLAALFAAVEFGIQPLFFHDAAGTPLYCPYPLSVAVPAMLLGHLTLAGLAELVVTAGVVAYLQRADPSLLRHTAPDAPDRDRESPVVAALPAWASARKLWLALGFLLIATPLGILTVASAWGEWSASDFADPAARREISLASGNHPAPAQPPRGLQRLSSIWTAPLPRYAPAFIRSPSFGYLVSALVGVGLIVITLTLFQMLLRPALWRPLSARRSFVEKTMQSFLSATENAFVADHLAHKRGLLQALDPRVKVAALALLILASSAVYSLYVLLALLVFALLLAKCSRLAWRLLFTRVALPILAFSGLLALPALFLTPGPVVYQLPLLSWPVTAPGLRSVALLLLRVETIGTLSTLLVLTTSWPRVLRALRFFRLPVTLVVLLGMTYRYLFLLLRTAREMFEARQSRLVGALEGYQRRRLAAASVGVLLSKSLALSGEVDAAMRSRGFTGEVYLLDEPAIRRRDWWQLLLCAALSLLAILVGR